MNFFTYSTFLAFFFYFFVYVSIANSTSVITVRTPDEIIIGADSFLGNEDGNQIGTICKIRQAGETFFAVSGVPLVRGAGIDFDTYKIATAIFSRKLPIEERLAIYDAIVKWNLIKVIDRVRQDKALFDLVYNHKDNVALSLTVAMTGGVFPTAYRIEHTVMSSANEPARISSVTKNYTDRLNSEIEIIYSIEMDKIICSPIIRTNNTRNLDKDIHNCIELIAKERPRVQLPADILRITQTGAEWIQHKPECQEIDQNFFNHSN